jgi:hypothetical protein
MSRTSIPVVDLRGAAVSPAGSTAHSTQWFQSGGNNLDRRARLRLVDRENKAILWVLKSVCREERAIAIADQELSYKRGGTQG